MIYHAGEERCQLLRSKMNLFRHPFTRETTRPSSSLQMQSYLIGKPLAIPIRLKPQDSKSQLTNLLILATEKRMEQPSLILNTLLKRQLLALVHNLLTSNDSHPTVASNSLSGLVGLLQQLFLATFDNLSRNTPFTSLLAAEILASEDKLHRLALADRTRQTLRPTCAGNCAQLDLRLAEGGVLRAVQDVAHQGQFAAAAEGVAGDCGDDGGADGVGEVGPWCDEVVIVGSGEAERCHLFDVGAGCWLGSVNYNVYIGWGMAVMELGGKGCGVEVEV